MVMRGCVMIQMLLKIRLFHIKLLTQALKINLFQVSLIKTRYHQCPQTISV